MKRIDHPKSSVSAPFFGLGAAALLLVTSTAAGSTHDEPAKPPMVIY